MLKFKIICFLKVNNEDESFKSSARSNVLLNYPHGMPCT